MTKPRWLLAMPVLSAIAFSTPVMGSAIKDRAGMFGSEAVKKSQAHLERLERTTHIPVVIETIDKVPGLDSHASPQERLDAINAFAVSRDNELKDEGIYLLISKNDHLNSSVLVRKRLESVLPLRTRKAIGDAFIDGFKAKDFDGGLINGVKAIEHAVDGVTAGGHVARTPAVLPGPVHRPAGVEKARGGQSTMGTFLLIMLGIFGVLLVLRLLGGLFGRSAGAGYPNQMGGMGMRGPGMGGGPGYYGGGGGGFFSGMLGGLGGALAGNWLYDQFSGRHGGMTSADTISQTDYVPDQGGDAIVGADDNPAGGTSWDDGGAADTGGGDWGGGGGDWGGGGGDWGGGGGDWGGGGGGGDW